MNRVKKKFVLLICVVFLSDVEREWEWRDCVENGNDVVVQWMDVVCFENDVVVWKMGLQCVLRTMLLCGEMNEYVDVVMKYVLNIK